MKIRSYITPVLIALLIGQCSGPPRTQDCAFQSTASRDSFASGQSVFIKPANSIPDGLGVNINFTDPQPGELKMLYEAGFRWVRMDLKWDLTEREQGVYDFSAYDRLMNALGPFGIRVLFILDYSNPNYDGGAPPRSEDGRQAFARWAVSAGKHYANRGVVWEIYNEPNISQFWPPRPKVDDYIALALAVGRAFREQAPNEQLIGPATSGIDFDFLEACFKAGLLEYWSGVSVHPYRRTEPETAADDYCRLRALINSYAPQKDNRKKQIAIVSGEWGYSAVWRGLSEEMQGQMLVRSMLTNLGNDIPISIWYDWQDDGLDAKEPEHHFGTVSHAYYTGRVPVYDPKPAYLGVQTLTSVLAGYQFQKRIDVGSEADYVLVFAKGANVVIAAWTSSNGERQLTVPLSPGEYKVMRYTGQPANDVTAAQDGLVIKVTTAPIYLQNLSD